MTPTPTVSVLMPVYNGETFLREAVDSILAQTFRDFEFLVVNDGSTDGTEQIIRSYADPRIRLVHNETNLGLIAGLNKGIGLCRGRYIARMDADDISVPERLEKQVFFMESHPDVGICGTWYDSFDDSGVRTRSRYATEHDAICYRQLYQIQLCHGTALIRREVLEKYGLRFDPDFSHAEDYDLFTRLGDHTRLANLPFVGYRVRQHPGEVSIRFRDVQLRNSNRIRHRGFERLGMPLSDAALADFTALAYGEYRAVEGTPGAVRDMLEGLVSADARTGKISPAFFGARLSEMWFHYCYHVSGPRMFRSSFLSRNTGPSWPQYIKWSIKTAFSR